MTTKCFRCGDVVPEPDLKEAVATKSVSEAPYLTSWCGGLEGNKQCNYNCKLCLIFSGKAELIKADDKCLKLTYRITE